MTRSFASMFSGGGLADIGMMQAGWTPLWGVEYDPAIAAVYRQNIHACILVADVRAVDYAALERPDHLHASPVCKNASVANSDGKESPVDLETAEAVCRAIRALRPDTFTLENVYGYRNFKAYQSILRTLCDEGYQVQQHHCNAADYGVAQTRRRLILRACRTGSLRPLQPTHSEFPQAQGMFAEHEPLLPWNGWYAAIEDLIPMLPESRFADWQLARLPQELFGNCLIEGDAAGDRCPTRSVGHDPSFTLKSAEGGRVHRAFLAMLDNPRAEGITTMQTETPSGTVQATAMRRPCNTPKAFLCHGTSTLEVRDNAEPSAAVMATVHAKAAMPRAFIVEQANASRDQTMRQASEPIFTIPVHSVKHPPPKAFLLSDQSGAAGEGLQIAQPDEPATTIRAGQRGGAVPRAFIVDGKPANYDGDLQVKGSASPTPTLTGSQTQHPFRAFVVHPNDMRTMPTRDEGEPIFTVMATGDAGFKPRAWLSQGRVVSMTPRALARFQSVPDWYELPTNKRLACTVLGNGVPCLMIQRIAESLT